MIVYACECFDGSKFSILTYTHPASCFSISQPIAAVEINNVQFLPFYKLLSQRIRSDSSLCSSLLAMKQQFFSRTLLSGRLNNDLSHMPFFVGNYETIFFPCPFLLTTKQRLSNHTHSVTTIQQRFKLLSLF